MNRAETEAFNQGLATAEMLARGCADAMRRREKVAPTRYPFATAALDAVADELAALAAAEPSAGAYTAPLLGSHS